MKKKFLVTCFTLLATGLMAGCAKEHVWEEATCTSPKTCVECGETEGEELGHTWVEATCASPKTCSVCNVTEGVALEHTLTDATYQSASTCTVCGEKVGEPLKAVFEEHEIVCSAEENVEYEYISICSSDPAKETVGTVVFSDYNTFASDESHPAREGYEWKTVVITQTFSDDNANNYGCVGFAPSFDYYLGVDFETIGNTLTYNGVEYSECEVHWSSLKGEWESQTYCSITQFEFLVPVGYDGIVITSINWANCADNPWVNDSVPAHIDDIDEDTILFRLE